MATKKEVQAWLDAQGWVFVEMTDAQKWEMRQALNICGAATSSSKYKFPCSKPPMPNGRCKTHRGGAAHGIAHHNYKHGKYVEDRYKPLRWVEALERASTDATLESLRRDLELVEAAIDEMLRRMDEGTSTDESMAAIIGTSRALLDAIRSEDDLALSRLLNSLDELVDTEPIDQAVKDELREWIDLRIRLVSEVSKSRQRLQIQMSVEVSYLHYDEVCRSFHANILKFVETRLIEKGVADDLLRAIQDDFGRAVGRPALSPPGS